jgi:hypothetical protein
MYALYQIKCSNSEIEGTNNYKPLKLVLGIRLAYLYIYIAIVKCNAL